MFLEEEFVKETSIDPYIPNEDNTGTIENPMYYKKLSKWLKVRLYKLIYKNKKFKKISKFKKEDFCDFFTLKNFLSCVDSGGFIPYDGTMQVIVDSIETNISIINWSCSVPLKYDEKRYMMDMKDLKTIKGKVKIAWYNK